MCQQGTRKPLKVLERFSNSEAEILDFEVLLDPVLRTLAAQSGFLDAAERRDLGGDEAGVDADDPGLEAFRGTPHAADVAPIEVRGEPELGIVRHRDRFF